jgi:hypothetical protein
MRAPTSLQRAEPDWRGAAAVAAVALAITAVIAAPVLLAPSERIFGREILGRNHDPFTVMVQFLRPISLGLHAQPVTDVAGALFARVMSPVAAYNALVLLSFPLAAAAAYLLGRHLALSSAGAALAAIAFAFSPFHLAHAASHVHIAQTQWLPLYLLALFRCLDEPTPKAVGLLAVATAAVTLSNFYGGLIAAVITPVAIGAYWLAGSRTAARSTRRLVITIGSLLIIAGAGVMYAWSVAHAVVVDRAAFAFPRADLFRYSARWWSYFLPPVGHPVLGDTARRIWLDAGVGGGLLEQQVGLGWGIIALGLAAFWRRTARDRQPSAFGNVSIIAALAAAAFVCSLSPERRIGPLTFVRPSGVLYAVAPMFRAYARFGVIVQLMAALLAGIGFDRLLHAGTRRGKIACTALVLLAVGEYAVWPPSLWRDVLPTAAHRWVARQPFGLRVLDCAGSTPAEAAVPWLTGRQLVPAGGRIDDCTEPNLPGKLAAEGFTHLLVRRRTTAGRWFASHPPPDGLRRVEEFGDSEVFAVSAPAPPVYTAALLDFSPREYEDARSWRRMKPNASWRVVNRSGRHLRAVVDVELSAPGGAALLELLLDGQKVQDLAVEEPARSHRVGPLALTPGDHELLFRPAEPPRSVHDPVEGGGRRTTAVACGVWRWTIPGDPP